MSHKRWQTLRLRKIEHQLREFWSDELTSARTYDQYSKLTERDVPREITRIVEAILTGTVSETEGALALLYGVRRDWAYRRLEGSAIENLEERFRMYAAALSERNML